MCEEVNREINQDMNQIKKLTDAFTRASGGETVLVIAENAGGMRLAINTLLLMPEYAAIPAHLKVNNLTNNEVYFQPKGSIRFFHKEHADWREDQQRIFSYPAEGVTQIVL